MTDKKSLGEYLAEHTDKEPEDFKGDIDIEPPWEAGSKTPEERAKEHGLKSGRGSQTLSRSIKWLKSKFNND